MSATKLTKLSRATLVGIVFLITALLIIALVLTGGCAPESIAVSADGVPISFQVTGSGTPALVFVNGWCCDKSYWDKQVSSFAKRHKVVIIDLAGHGESGLGREAYTMAAFGEDVVAVVNKLGIDKVVLIGHSMGGFVMLEAARLMPERVMGLVGVDNLQNFEFKLTQEQIDDWFTPLRSNFVEGTKNFVRGMFTTTADYDLVEKIVADMSSAPPTVGFGALEGYVNYQNNELIHALKEVQAQITCINSDWYPTDVEINQSYVPSYKAKIIPGLGHFVMLEDPETFNRLLEEVVAEFVRPAGSE